jgi:hypothetical protein
MWFRLPFDIRNHVLFYFCKDIIDDFSVFLSFKLLAEEYKYYQLILKLSERLVWPPGPDSLRSFSSEIGTCHDFYDIISDHIQFEGTSTTEILGDAQYHILKRLVELMENFHFGEEAVITRVFRMAGCF